MGDEIQLDLREDPNPLGVEMPEELEILMEEDWALKDKFNSLTMGKMRNVIHQIMRIKNIDLKVQRAEELIRSS